MFNGTRKRLAVAGDRTRKTGIRIFAFLEVFCFFSSLFLLAVLGVGIVLAGTTAFELKGAALGFFQVALTAAVGFLTNWLAVEMIFKPYRPLQWFWIWPQGLVPRNKMEIGKKAGEKIQSELLKPEEISKRLNRGISEMFDGEETRREISDKILRLTREVVKETLNTQIERFLGEQVPEESNVFSRILGGSRNRIGDLLKGIASGRIEGALSSEKMSKWVEEDFIPLLKPMIETAVSENTPKILENIELGKIIADQIEKQDAAEFHQMIDDVAAEHLGAIQVLGFFLGGLIGMLQLLL